MTGLLPYSPLNLLLRLLPDRCGSLRCVLILCRALFPVVWPFIQTPGFPVRVVVRVELIGVVIEVALSAHNHLPVKSWQPHIMMDCLAAVVSPNPADKTRFARYVETTTMPEMNQRVGLPWWNWRKGLGNWKAEVLVVSKVNLE